MRAVVPAIFATSIAAGCSLSGKDEDDTATDSGTSVRPEADLLLVIDTSTSMEDEAAAFAGHLSLLFDALTGANAIVRMGVTTSSADYSGGSTGDVDPGEAGLLLGDPAVVSTEDSDGEANLRGTLLCEATCWSESDLQSDPSYTCESDPLADDPPERITVEYLDCACGSGTWEDHCGAGTEEHLEATLLALCRAVDAPPEACYDPTSAFVEGDEGTNEGLLGDGTPVVAFLITDEGDTSRRLPQGDGDPQTYLDAFAALGVGFSFAAAGPAYDSTTGSLSCNSGGATTWGTERLQITAVETSGFYADIATDDSGECAVSDFSAHLDLLATLLNESGG